jgi:hypothetical protein
MRTIRKAGGAQTSVTLGAPLSKGDYLSSDRDLYYVEYLGPERVLLEDCRTGTLLDVELADIGGLQPVIR